MDFELISLAIKFLEKCPITRVIVDPEASILESIFGCDKCYKIYIRKNMYIYPWFELASHIQEYRNLKMAF